MQHRHAWELSTRPMPSAKIRPINRKEFPLSSSALKTGVHVQAGRDRYNENGLMIWGLIPLATKVAAADTAGGLYIFQHTSMGKGGPPRHIHHAQDEWFYAVQGEFAVEIGEEKFRLKPGDSLLAPRKIPHVWACVSDAPGTIITAVSPAGTFETFIRDTTRHPTLPTPEDVAKHFAAHGMTVVGPPLTVD
jgi:mannose-6-phosphate isomerase-like protein (cupin superfamily)